MNKQTEDDTDRTSSNLSAAIPSPRKALAKYIEDVFFWLVTTWTVTLVFPFHWMISIPTAFLLGVAICTAMFASRADRPKRYRRWFRLVTLTAIVLASVWALLGPVLIARPALYVVTRQGWNPLTSSFIPVKVGKEVVAHVMIVADPVRKAAYSVMARPFKYVRLSAFEDGEDSPYVRLPSLQQLTWAENESGHGIRESIDVFAVSNSLTFDLNLKGERSIDFGSAGVLTRLVSVEFMANSRTPPWHGVLVGHSAGDDAFKYVALLDLALRAIIEGNNSEAWKLLQECVRAGPPHEMEQARALTLEARYAAAVSQGRLGKLQALLYAQPAANLLLAHESNKKSNPHSPLAQWIQTSLVDVLRNYQEFTKADLKPLETLQMAPLKNGRSGLFNKKWEEWRGLPTSELLRRISSREIKALADTVRIREIVSDRAFDKMREASDLLRKGSEPASDLDASLAALDELRQVLNIITEAAREEGAAGSSNYVQQLFIWYESYFRAFQNGASDEAIEAVIISCPDIGLRNTLLRTILTHNTENESEDVSLRPLPGGSSGRWWEPQFQEWILSAYLRFFTPHLGKSPFDSADALKRITAQIPLETLGRDTDGTGEPYLPGLFIACLISRQMAEQRAEDLITKFEELSGIDFRKFAAAL